MHEVSALAATVALNDGAAASRVLAQQLRGAVGEITQRYPNNRLGGLVERLQELVIFAGAHAEKMTSAADAVMRSRPELEGLPAETPISTPPGVLAVFEQAELLTHFISVPEAARVAEQGKLVVLRDKRVQATHLVPKGAVIFDAAVDPALVRLWWPRIFSREMQVAILPTTVDGVWLETTFDSEDLPPDQDGSVDASPGT